MLYLMHFPPYTETDRYMCDSTSAFSICFFFISEYKRERCEIVGIVYGAQGTKDECLKKERARRRQQRDKKATGERGQKCMKMHFQEIYFSL